MRFVLFINLFLLMTMGEAQSPVYWERQGDEASEHENWSAAFASYKESFDLDSSVFERRVKLARAAFESREDPLAIRYFQSASRIDQGKIHPESYFFLCKIMQRNGRYDEAIFYAKKFKQRAKGKKDYKTLLEQSDAVLSASQWALNQTPVDSILLKSSSINTDQNEGQPYWQSDTLYYLAWNEAGWLQMKTDTAHLKKYPSRDQWNGTPVLHIIAHQQEWIGVGLSSDGQLVLLNKSSLTSEWGKMQLCNAQSGNSSMPFIGNWNGVDYLIFSSDREGGKGGLDLWLSRFTNGNWGIPFNAGDINSVEDDIEPRCINGELYFSSNGHVGFGEFDLFKVPGQPGSWGRPINLGLPLNSCKNDIGLDVLKTKDEQRWVLGSARNSSGCCPDILEYQWLAIPKDTVSKTIIPTEVKKIQQWLPLKLFFHNDEPNPNSWDTLTQWTFTNCQTSYLNQESNYIQQFKGDAAAIEDWESFKDIELVKTYNQLQQVLLLIESRLTFGDTITLTVRGFASPLADGKYNQNLTSRRIMSLRNEIIMFHNGALRPYIDQTLLIHPIPFGESTSKKISDDKANQRMSVYSAGARLERRIEIESIDWKSRK